MNMHAKTNMQVIQQFLRVRFDVREVNGYSRVSVYRE